MADNRSSKVAQSGSSTPSDDPQNVSVIVHEKGDPEDEKDGGGGGTKKPDEKKELVRIPEMFRFADRYDLFLITLGSIAAIGNGSAMAAYAAVLGQIYDSLNSPGTDTIQYVLIFVYMGIALLFAASAQVTLFTTAAERMTIRMRCAYFRAILSQDVAFFDAQNSGALTSQVAENSVLYREALGEKLGFLAQYAAMGISGLIVGFYFLWQLALVILALSPLMGAVGYFMITTISQNVSGQLDSYASAGAIAEESLTMIRTVTAFNLQRGKIEQYRAEVDKAAKRVSKQGLFVGMGFGAMNFVMFGAFATALYTGSVLIANSREAAYKSHPPMDPMPPELSFCAVGQPIPALCSTAEQGNVTFDTIVDVCGCFLCRCGCFFVEPGEPVTSISTCTTGGDIILTLFAVLFGSMALGQSASPLNAFTNGRAAAAALYRVIDRKPEMDLNSDEGSKLDVASVKGEIVFENVGFSYPSRREAPVFKNLTLRIPAGKRVALVGESGSGKSTCIALLERYYDPDSGCILLDGQDLRNINIKSLRSAIGLVSQEPILFGTSILENVRYGRPDATDEEVIEACKEANAHRFIANFPDGYNTHVSSSLVSGGQKQRIAIARALLRNPPILLLDEATAALDNESERLVNEAIDKLLVSSSGARTTIVIAHRLSSIRECDRIYVLEKGSLVEEGNHDQLMANDGLYASLNKLSEGGKLGAAKQKHHDRLKATQTGPTSEKVDTEDIAKIDVEDAPKESRTAEASSEEEDGEVGVGKKKRYSIFKAFKYAWPERYLFIPAAIAATVDGAMLPIFVFFFSAMLDSFFFTNIAQMRSSVNLYSIGFTCMAVGGALAVFTHSRCFYHISGQMTKRARVDVFRHILSMEIGFFDEKKNHVGALSSKLASDAAMLKAAICDRLGAICMNTSTIVVGYVIAMTGSWKVTLVITGLFPIFVIAGMVEFMAMTGLAGSDAKATEEAAHTLSESVSGIRTVAAFNMQQSVERLYYNQLLIPMKKALRKGTFAGGGYGISQSMQFFCLGFAFWYGSKLVQSGEISFRGFNQALFGVIMSASALGNNAAMTPDLAKGSNAVQSIFSLLDRKSKINPLDDSDTGTKPSVVVGDITFENVQFSYPTRPNVTVLDRFNLEIKRGQTVAFVGTSGSGKSTLVLLLERFYDPNGGLVKIDGHDVRDLDVEWLRDQIGIVSQEPALLKGTIMENIRAGRPDATDEEVIQAAKSANAHDFIMAFPLGYQTDIFASTGVSGGQKQRIAIARALIRNPKILLLDEATSALDEESQKVVQQALDDLLKESSRTTIVVAHRLSTIRNADHIVVLQNGVVVEQGSFDELLAKGGAFESLLRAQDKHYGT